MLRNNKHCIPVYDKKIKENEKLLTIPQSREGVFSTQCWRNYKTRSHVPVTVSDVMDLTCDDITAVMQRFGLSHKASLSKVSHITVSLIDRQMILIIWLFILLPVMKCF